MSGTSMAAPHVAGAAALLLSINPDITTAELKALLLDNVDVVPELSSYVSTSGRLNVYKAVEAMAFVTSVPNLSYDGTVYTLNTINLSTTLEFWKSKNVYVVINRYNISNIIGTVSGSVSIDSSGNGTYTPVSTEIDFVPGEHIEILVYKDSTLENLITRQIVSPIFSEF